MSETGEWAINVSTPKDAHRHGQLAGKMGFVYTSITTLLPLIAWLLSISNAKDGITEATAKQTMVGAIAILVRFAILWFLSWRTYLGGAIVSSVLLFALILIEIVAAYGGLTLQNARVGIVTSFVTFIIPFVILYTLYAGMLGSYAERGFIKHGWTDKSVF